MSVTFIEPLKSLEDIRTINNYLKKTSSRNHLLFNLGINIPMKLNDLLLLKVGDVRDKEEIYINVGKKIINFPLGKKLKEIIKNYCKNKNDYEYLFKSQRYKINQPIKISQANKVIKSSGIACNISNLGGSSLRKTFAYHYYQQTKNIGALMKLLNHHDQYFTLQYIGMNKNYFNNLKEDFKEIF